MRDYMLAIYCLLRELGACNVAVMVFDPDWYPSGDQISWLLSHTSLPAVTVVTITHMYQSLPRRKRRIAACEIAYDVAWLIDEQDWRDNTFFRRYAALKHYWFGEGKELW